MKKTNSLFGAALIAGIFANVPVQADAMSDFYRGKNITFLVGSDPGGSFGPYAQILAEHMPKYIPEKPKFIIKYTGGESGGLNLANSVRANMPVDGTTIAMTQQTIVLNQVLQPQYAKYDAREWLWLGNMAPVRNMLSIWHTAKAQTIAEAKTTEVIIGATGPSSPTYIVPNLLNKFLGTKYKIVTGYKGAADLNLAMQRGEIEGRGASWVSVQLAMPDAIADGRINPVVFASITREPSAPDVPTLAEIMTDPVHRQVAEFLSAESDFGRSVFMPPGVPADRVAMMREAFQKTMKDEAFLADAKRLNLTIEPMTHEQLAKITAKVVSAPKEVIELAK